MGRLRTARAARDDLREIRAFSKLQFGDRVARDYLEGLSALFDLIEARPRAGVAEPEFGGTMRSFGYRSHRVYYRLDGEDVLVVRILHHAREATSILRDDQ